MPETTSRTPFNTQLTIQRNARTVIYFLTSYLVLRMQRLRPSMIVSTPPVLFAFPYFLFTVATSMLETLRLLFFVFSTFPCFLFLFSVLYSFFFHENTKAMFGCSCCLVKRALNGGRKVKVNQ